MAADPRPSLRRVPARRAGAALLAGALLAAPPALAENFALVVGIDDYAVMPDLAGAGNDARLIADSLLGFGVRDMKLLLDRQATRAGIEAAFFGYLDRAQRGDTIIFTYSGHGRHIPDENGDEASAADPGDHEDETLVLADFSAADPGEELIDDELAEWFARADAKGVTVVFLSDSCHSGTVNRGGRTRMVDEYAMEIAPLARPLSQPIAPPEDTLENIVFLAGAPETVTVQEVMIDGRYHGALSYAFARALRNDRGDLDRDGRISRDELASFIPRTARAVNEGRILPDVVARPGPDFFVLVPDADGISLTVPPAGAAMQQAAVDYDRVPLAAHPELVWDRRSGDVHDPSGELVASAVEESRLPDLDTKLTLLSLVREGLVVDGVDVEILGPDRAVHDEYRLGEGFTVEVGPLPHAYLTVFNIANSGEMQLIYPITPQERGRQSAGETITFKAVAAEPAGIDHIVAVSSDMLPRELQQQLGWSMSIASFLPTLEKLVVGEDVAFGLAGIATRRE